MVVTSKVVLTAAMAFSFVIQVLLLCSANAYPAEDFFFTDQPKIVHKRAAVERKKAAREENKINALKTIMNGIDTEDGGSGMGPDGGSGVGPDEGNGVGPDEGNGVGPNEGSGSGFIEGSGDDTTSTYFETNTGTEQQTSSLSESITTTMKVTGLTEQTETTGKEANSETPTVLPASTTTLRDESSEKEGTIIEVSTRLVDSSVTLAETSVTLTGSSVTLTYENTETLPTQQLTTEEEILSPTTDPSQLSTLTLSHTILQTALTKTPEEILSTERKEPSTISLGTEETTGGILSTEMTEPSTTITLATEEPEPPAKLVSIQVCGKRFYCLAGRRGPCPANEVLVEDINKNDLEAPSYCSALSSSPWRGCLSSVNEETAATTLTGRCNLKSTEKPCSGLPSNYRYHPIRKICRPTSSSTGNWLAFECGDDQVFLGLNQNLGSCVCLNQQHLIYTGDNQCYHPYTRGPCNKGMWLVPSSRREMDCRSSPCPANDIDGRHYYWKGDFHGPAGCYRINTRGPCPEGRIFIVDDPVLGHARCEFDRLSA